MATGLATTSRLGIIAGKGELAKKLIDVCEERARPYLVVTLSEENNANDFQNSPHMDIPIGKVGHLLQVLKDQSVGEIVMVGKINRPIWSELVPDAMGMKLLAKILAKRLLGDDAILSTVVRFFEQQGIHVVGVDTLLTDLLASRGTLGFVYPTPLIQDDIALGRAVLESLGRFDIGQAVVIHQGRVLGIEGAEGTDQLMDRCSPFCKAAGGGVLVKMKKPHQERRVDLPAIGQRTVIEAENAGIKAIAVEAGGSLIVGKEKVLQEADRAGIAIVGF